MAHHSTSDDSQDHIQPQPFESLKPHQLLKQNIMLKQEKEEVESDKDDAQTKTTTSSKTHLSKNMEIALQQEVAEAKAEEENGRERLKKHRVEVAGKVWIPDIWGQEELLKDWIDCTTAFDVPLVPSKIMSARTALVQEVRGESNGGLKIQNGC